MIAKIKNKRLYVKGKKGTLLQKMPDHFVDEGMIVMNVEDDGGILAIKEEDIYLLTLDNDELEIAGWVKFKADLFDEGTITQADIDNEKVKPDTAQKIADWRDRLASEVQKDPELKARVNAIKAKHGKPPI